METGQYTRSELINAADRFREKVRVAGRDDWWNWLNGRSYEGTAASG